MEKYPTSKLNSKSKLKLFGFEINPSHQTHHDTLISENNDLQSLGSSAASENNLGQSKSGNKNKKYECQWCFKVLANSQALGGHQNAHKKERMRKKWLQLQARQVEGLSHYLNNMQFQDSYDYNTSDYDCSAEFYIDEGTRISFSAEDQYSKFEFEQECINGFSLTHSAGSSSNNYTNYKV